MAGRDRDRMGGATAERFAAWADEPFDPGPRLAGAGEGQRVALALEYIAYQLHHIRVSLSELAATAEPPPERGRRLRRHA